MFRYLWLGFVVKVLVVLLVAVPLPKTVIAEWTVQVIDQNDRPVSDIRVSSIWNDYTFGLSGGSDLRTNPEGIVRFAGETQFRPVLYWAIKAAVTQLNLHSSSGFRGRVWVSDPTINGASAHCLDGQCTKGRLQSELMVRR